MTSSPSVPSVATVGGDGGDRMVRLSVKPPLPVTGFVDGAWWPRSRDLSRELPALLAELNERLDGIERVSYHLGDWGPTPRRISADGLVVRLGGFRFQHAGTVDVLGPRMRVTLLVIPPTTSPKVAEKVLERAGRPGDATAIEDLLSGCTSEDAGAIAVTG